MATCISTYLLVHRGVLLESIHSTVFKKASPDCNYVWFFHEHIVPGCMRTLVGHFFIIDQNQCTIYIMATIYRAALMQCILYIPLALCPVAHCIASYVCVQQID